MDVLEFPGIPYFAQDLCFQAFDAVVFAGVAQGALRMVGKDDVTEKSTCKYVTLDIT